MPIPVELDAALVKQVITFVDANGFRTYNLPNAIAADEPAAYGQLTAMQSALEDDILDEAQTRQSAVAQLEAAIAAIVPGLSESQTTILINQILAAKHLNDFSATDNVAMSGHKLTGLGDGAAMADAATIGQLRAAMTGRLKAVSVQGRFDGSLADLQALVGAGSGGRTIVDSQAVYGTDYTSHVLLISPDAAESGVYQLIDETEFERLDGFVTAADWAPYTQVYVDRGDTYGNTVWFNPDAATPGAGGAIASLVFAPFGRLAELSVANASPLRKAGNTLNFAYSDEDFEVDSSGLRLSGGVRNRFTTLDGQMAALDSEVETANSAITTHTTQIAGLSSTTAQHSTALDGLDLRLDSVEGEQQTQASAISNLQSTDATQQSAINSAATNISALQTESATLAALVQQLEATLVAAQATIASKTASYTDTVTNGVAADSATERASVNLPGLVKFTFAHTLTNLGRKVSIEVMQVVSGVERECEHMAGIIDNTHAWVCLPETGVYRVTLH